MRCDFGVLGSVYGVLDSVSGVLGTVECANFRLREFMQIAGRTYSGGIRYISRIMFARLGRGSSIVLLAVSKFYNPEARCPSAWYCEGHIRLPKQKDAPLGFWY